MGGVFTNIKSTKNIYKYELAEVKAEGRGLRYKTLFLAYLHLLPDDLSVECVAVVAAVARQLALSRDHRRNPAWQRSHCSQMEALGIQT